MRIIMAMLAALGLVGKAEAQTQTQGKAEREPAQWELEIKAKIEAISANPTEAQLARKARSDAAIEALGLSPSLKLPVITDENASTRRTVDQVAGRAIALMVVAVKGELRRPDVGDMLLDQYEAHKLTTAYERAYLEDRNPSEDTYVDMTWRYESAKVMLWALGFVDELGPADEIADAAALGNLVKDKGSDGLRAGGQLRTQQEILDMADLHYRLHWIAVNARVNGEPLPEGIMPSITYERLFALNWLYGYLGLDWDNMRADT